MTNEQILARLTELADYFEMRRCEVKRDGVASAYKEAAEEVRILRRHIERGEA